MAKISSENVKGFFVEGGKVIAGLALDFYGDSINQAGESAFSDAIEIGITNTISALYDSNVSDDGIIIALNKHWGLAKDEAESRLIFEKSQATIKELEHFLKLQGFNPTEIRDFMKTNRVSIKIRHNKDLWKLRRNPEKLMKEVQEIAK